MRITTKLDFKPLKKAARIHGTVDGKRMFRQLGVAYRSFLQRRFARYSRGSGNWPKLQPATEERKGSTTILRHTDVMFQALRPSNPGAGGVEIVRGSIITLGFGGSEAHPEAEGLTIARLAEIHNFGEGNMPERKIVVPPDGPALANLKDIVQKTLNKRFR